MVEVPKEQLNHLIAMRKILDDANVPKGNRQLTFIGKNGRQYTITEGQKIPRVIAKQMPEYLIQAIEEMNKKPRRP